MCSVNVSVTGPRWGGNLMMMPAAGSRQGVVRVKALVTGVAGFIGSTLAERLVAQGAEVAGIDCFSMQRLPLL